MNRNVEIKAGVADWNAVTERVVSIAEEGPIILNQEDIFYYCTNGRLKLRKLTDTEGELIYYHRPDDTSPTECNYIRSSTSRPDELHEILSRSLGVRGVVKKRRTLYRVGQTRVHLDEVDGLGRFMELEVVLKPDQDVNHGQRITEDLIDRLKIAKDDLIALAYIDLIEGK